MPTDQDHLAARELAAMAGDLLMAVRSELQAAQAPAAEIKAAGDRAAHEMLIAELGQRFPNDEVLSEESSGSRESQAQAPRLTADRVWIIDPLDGTREFSETGRGDWAVHVALVAGGELTAGAVALPAQRRVLSTADRFAPLPEPSDPPRIVISRTRPPAEAMVIASHLGGELIEMGSAGAKAMTVVLGASDCYPHSGGQYEWDSAAPVAVARAAGLHCSRLSGAEIVYNRPDPYLPDILICHPAMTTRVFEALEHMQ